MDIWIVVVVVSLSVGGSGRRSICILERLNQVQTRTRTPSRQLCVRHRPKTRDKTKDRQHSTKSEICVDFPGNEGSEKMSCGFMTSLATTVPWNLMDTTFRGGSPLPQTSLTNKFEFVFRVCVYFFLAFSCIFFALDEQQQQNESLIRSFWVKPIGENVYVGVDLSRAVPSALPAQCDAYMYYMRGRLLIKSCMPYTSMLR